MTDQSNIASLVPDAELTGLMRLLPARARPYAALARFDRPIGWWLLFWPCVYGLGLAGSLPQLWAMRGAGCVYNDIIDRDLDRQVARTRNRPLASGAVSVKAAVAFLLLLCGIGLAVLLSFDRFSIVLGFASLVPVAIYPFMKRITSWPQAVLGLAFSWGALMGWAAAFGELGPEPILLYAGAIFWTVAYDTIYAVQDLEDDAVAGIRSTTRMFSARTRHAVGLFFALAVGCIAAAVWAAGGALPSFIGVGLFALHLAIQVRAIDLADPGGALRLFKSNRDAGLILFAGLAADALIGI